MLVVEEAHKNFSQIHRIKIFPDRPHKNFPPIWGRRSRENFMEKNFLVTK
jgi:hypothetical protein